MKIPMTPSHSKIEIEKSLFLSNLFIIKSQEEAKEKVKSLWKEHPQANHIVWAFVLGEKGEILGRSDDGEPSGTAGNPMLEQIKGNQLTGTLITAIRYFGGVKLGTGGLVRAYAQCAKSVITQVQIKELEPILLGEIELPYHLYEQFNILIANPEFIKKEEIFAETIQLKLEYPQRRNDQLKKELQELSSGRLTLKTTPVPSPLQP